MGTTLCSHMCLGETNDFQMVNIISVTNDFTLATHFYNL